jgi:hypothetical protein
MSDRQVGPTCRVHLLSLRARGQRAGASFGRRLPALEGTSPGAAHTGVLRREGPILWRAKRAPGSSGLSTSSSEADRELRRSWRRPTAATAQIDRGNGLYRSWESHWCRALGRGGPSLAGINRRAAAVVRLGTGENGFLWSNWS